MNKLKELSTKFGSGIKSQNLINGNINQRSTKRLLIKNYKKYDLKIDEYENIYSIGIKVNSDLTFSINRIDDIFGYRTLIYYPIFKFKVYARETDLKDDARTLKLLTSFAVLFDQIKFTDDESIFLYKNYLYFYLNAERNLLLILDKFIDLIQENREVFVEEVKKKTLLNRLPINLRPLSTYIKKYAISDDAEREQLIGEMSESEKSTLIRAVKPLFADINTFLNSFKEEPLSEEAVSIGELAELVSELLINGPGNGQ